MKMIGQNLRFLFKPSVMCRSILLACCAFGMGAFTTVIAVAADDTKSVSTSSTKMIEVSVTGMTCDSCSNAIKSSVGKLENVVAVKADHASGRVVIECGATCPDKTAVVGAIEKLGYGVTGK